MSKIIKLNLNDLHKIVNKVVTESEFDDFDTQVQPEELPGADDHEEMEKINLTIAQDASGKTYVIKDASTNNPEVLDMDNLPF